MSTENEFFKVLWFRVQVEEAFSGHGRKSSEATIKVEVRTRDGKTETVHKVADGIGPVNALDNALRKALNGFFPEVANVCLVDYEVHKRNGKEGTESLVEVTITSSDGTNKWVTKATSGNIIRASLVALAKSLKSELLHMMVPIKAPA